MTTRRFAFFPWLMVAALFAADLACGSRPGTPGAAPDGAVNAGDGAIAAEVGVPPDANIEREDTGDGAIAAEVGVPTDANIEREDTGAPDGGPAGSDAVADRTDGAAESPGSDGSRADTEAGVDASGGGSDGGGAADGGAPLCQSTAPVAPVATIGAYAQWRPFACSGVGNNAARPCALPALFDGLLSCDAVSFERMDGLGIELMRVAERRATTCVFDYWSRGDGAGRRLVCELPLPLRPWVGLAGTRSIFSVAGLVDGIQPSCTTVATCSFSMGATVCDPSYAFPPTDPVAKCF
ncbi:MAG: hypothetical protein ABUS79_06555 [Pseudomonadota bacterium]